MTLELDVRTNALGGRRTKLLFDMLLAAEGDAVSLDRLATGLWGDSPPRDVATTLHTYVSVLRNRLEPGVAAHASVIVEEDGGIRFTLAERRAFARTG